MFPNKKTLQQESDGVVSVFLNCASIKVKNVKGWTASARGKKLMALCLSIVGTMLLPAYISDGTISFSNSFVSIAWAAVMFMLFLQCYNRSHTRRELVFAHTLGFILSFMIAAGRAIEQTGSFFPISVLKAVAIMFYTHAAACVISFVWENLSRLKSGKPATQSDNARFARFLSYAAAHPWLIALGFLLCWLPCYIALFPGGFRYDIHIEFNQQYDTYLSCFPRLHSALLIGCLNAVHGLTGSYNAGIAVYCAVQMILFSGVFTHMLVVFYRQRMSAVLLCVLWSYYAFSPVIHLTITNAGRDTLFALLFVYLVTLLYETSCDVERFMRSKGKSMCLGIVLALTVLSRNNTSELIVMLLLIVLLGVAWLWLHKVCKRGMAVCAVSCLVVYVSLSLVLGAVCSPMKKANQGAALGILTQTLARAKTDEPQKWSVKDNADFNRFVDAENLKYCAELADISREAMNEDAIKSDIGGFVWLWLRMGLKCPNAYLNAFTAQTRYGWYPDSVIDGYIRAEIYHDEKNFFKPGVAPPGSKVHIWNSGEEFYRKISCDISFEKIPIVSMLFSIGFHNWLVLHCFVYAVYRRSKKMYLPLGVMMGYLMICLLLPIVIMRYYMPLYLLFPLTAVMTVRASYHSGEETDVSDRLDTGAVRAAPSVECDKI